MLLLYLSMSLIGLAVFLLYDVTLEPFWYAQLMGAVVMLGVFLIDIAKETRRAKARSRAMAAICDDEGALPEPMTRQEEDYQQMIHILRERMEQISLKAIREKEDIQDYYTAWVHQIKTPIAVMKLNLQNSDGALKDELFRVEQYVDMVLSYIRLETDSNDLVIREYDLNDIIRESVRKYAPQFIMKKLRLEYEPVEAKAVTDKKWLSVILDQLLSNAVKYTESGGVTIHAGNQSISISDTGVGIREEDIPRIFEKGYTGINGRSENHASGLGLFLAGKAAEKLSIRINVESKPGMGTTFTLFFPER